jgi:hypothetical protein
MNRLKVLFAVLLSASAMVSCEKPNEGMEPAEEILEVTANNIMGKWHLVEVNGVEQLDGTCVYLDINRDYTFTLYQNTDGFSDVMRALTGKYNFDEVPMVGTLIRGKYDYSGEEWSSRYIISYLTRTTMIWVDRNDAARTQKFVRVDEIPVIE